MPHPDAERLRSDRTHRAHLAMRRSGEVLVIAGPSCSTVRQREHLSEMTDVAPADSRGRATTRRWVDRAKCPLSVSQHVRCRTAALVKSDQVRSLGSFQGYRPLH